MSNDVDYDMSDEDRPLTSRTNITNGKPNGHVASNGNGRFSGSASDSPMSEDEDLPLSQTLPPKRAAVPSRQRKRRAVSSGGESSSDGEAPLASTPAKTRRSAAVPMPGAVAATTVSAALVNGKAHRSASAVQSDGSDSDETPINSQLASTSKSSAVSTPAKRKTKAKALDNEAFAGSASDAEPTPKKGKAAPTRRKRKVKDEPEDDVAPTKKRGGARVKNGNSGADTPSSAPPKKRARVKKEDNTESGTPATDVATGKGKKKEKDDKEKEEEDEEKFRWWEMEQDVLGDGSQKWTKLEHSGVLFPPPYEPLPSNIKMKYNGKSVDLPPASEEVAGFYGAMIETEHAKDDTFNSNFFADWLKVLKKHPPRDGTKITDFKRCDFRPMYEYFEAERAKKKALTSAEKKELKKQKDEAEAKYTHCTLDGRKEKVGNFRIEPPGLFRGRGEHPKKGALKLRVRPEDVTINIAASSAVPKPNVAGKWKEVIHDNTVTWLATWIENVNGNHKYVFLAAGSSLKGQSDMMKFEKARELKKHIDRVRADYQKDLGDKVMMHRMRATAMYFIDKLALRAGNEKGEDEADTVGCCSLRCEHVTLEPPSSIVFDFLGKDSIRYYNKVEVDPRVFKNIKIFKRGKQDSDDLFDRINPTLLNKHLQSYMKGLSAKVFRTYNASITFQEQLDHGTPENGTVQEKLNHYNHANRMVAILCNHQRAVPKTHEQSMGKMKEKLRGFKYERMKLRHALFTADAKYKKMAEYKADESDLDDDDIAEHEDTLKTKELEKVQKKFAKDNEKLAEEGKSALDDDVLKSRLDAVEDEFKRLKRERGTGKAELKRDKPVEKIEESIAKLDEKIKAFKLQMEDREAGKEVALTTSKINYLDPRITAAWCKKYDVPIEKLFSKTLITKFPWALDVDTDWKF